jgi:hypothetical protein
MEQSQFETIKICQLVKNLPALNGIGRFVTVLKRDFQLSPVLIQINPVHTIKAYLT